MHQGPGWTFSGNPLNMGLYRKDHLENGNIKFSKSVIETLQDGL